MASVNNTTNASTTSSYSYLQYKNKIGGLVSGMDIDSIMEKLMKAESAQMEKLQQQKQKYEWKRDAYREVNTTLSAFSDGLWDNYGTSSNWNTKTVTSTSSAISATASSSASGTLNITEAKAAKAGYLVTELGKIIGTDKQITDSTTMADLGITDSGSFKIKALCEDGKSYTEKEIKYSATDKVSNIMSKINSSGVGVTAIASGSQISLTANNAGKGDDAIGSFAITEDTKGLFYKLGLSNTSTPPSSTSPVVLAKNGDNGHIKVNGITIDGTSNKYSISGYNITVNEDIAAGSISAKVSSTTDTDSLVSKVKEFVDTYNGLIADLNTRVTEKKNVDYNPLTDAQKAEMTADEISKWEVKAKAGLLKGDTNINSALSSMRTTLSQYGQTSTDGNGKTVYGNGSGDSLYKIGITTSSTWSENGKLVIDEDKLRAAIEEDPNVVARIFTGNS